jgi:ankyrin repeat protein
MTLPVASLKILVEQGGAFVNQVDKDGDNALKLAASMDDADCVEYLLKVGADVFHSEGHNGSVRIPNARIARATYTDLVNSGASCRRSARVGNLLSTSARSPCIAFGDRRTLSLSHPSCGIIR